MNTLPLLFNDVDGYEVLVIILVVLIFFGPKSIPGIAKSLGRALYSIRNASDELKNEIKKSGVDIKKELNIDQLIKQQEAEIVKPLDQAFSDVSNTVHYEGQKLNTTIKSEETISNTSDSEIAPPPNDSSTESNKSNE